VTGANDNPYRSLAAAIRRWSFIFTVGWGKYFYHGTHALVESVTG